jgi:hypothetical protein
MHPRGPSTALFLVMIVLIAGLLTGCGGGDQSGSGGSQQGDGAKENGAKENRAKEKKGNAPEKKIVLGTVRFVNAETKRFTVRPSTEQQGEKPIVFKLAKKATVTLDGKEVELGDMKKGQQAQVEYVVRNDHNRARSVKLFAGDQGG